MLPVQGALTAIGLAAFAFFISMSLLSVAMSLIFLLYIVITTLYSVWLKHYSTIDVITLTCLYTLRIVAGGVAISAVLSPWLLNFSLFFFLSLALMKRYIELVRVQKAGKEKSRGYYVTDLQAVLPMGIANGGLAVLTLTLYLNSEYVAQTYASPTLLWLVAPLTLFWVYRAWIWALRDKIDDDPVVFALRDKISRLTLFLTCALVISAKFISLEAWFQ
jgi:4-hydroxybenzoate polyprenyltransferase